MAAGGGGGGGAVAFLAIAANDIGPAAVGRLAEAGWGTAFDAHDSYTRGPFF